MQRIHIKTYGCAHNMADSETMAQYLQEAGYTITGISNNDQQSVAGGEGKQTESDLLKKADLIIYNTCTVKNPSEDKFFSQLKKTSSPVIIAGCIPQSERDAKWLDDYSAIGVEQLHKIVSLVEKTLKGKIVHELSKSKTPLSRNFVPMLRKNSLIAIIPILQGCLGNCTYCKTKFARGSLKSYPLKDIIKQIRIAKHEGIKEIWLVSEDNGAYGLDIKTNFVKLLNEIIKLGEGPKIRIGMFNPEYAYKYRNELAEIYQHPIFYKFAHIPIQAGDNKVLQEMKRPYTVEEFEESIKVIKEKNPNMSFATDIICGFPTETKEQFKETMKLVKRHDFAMINISKFYPRSGTVAAKMKILPTKEVKERSKELSEWFRKQNYNKEYEGTTVKALVSEVGKNNSLIARLENYKQVIIKNCSDKNLIGEEVKVKIQETTRDDLRGELV